MFRSSTITPESNIVSNFDILYPNGVMTLLSYFLEETRRLYFKVTEILLGFLQLIIGH